MGGAGKVMDSSSAVHGSGGESCGGGPGTTTFDMLAALEQWVERRNRHRINSSVARVDGRWNGRGRSARIRKSPL